MNLSGLANLSECFEVLSDTRGNETPKLDTKEGQDEFSPLAPMPLPLQDNSQGCHSIPAASLC